MSLKTSKVAIATALSVCGMGLASLANAIDVSVSGFVRQEMAYKISSEENPNNRGGFTHNGEQVLLEGGFMPPGGIPCGAGTAAFGGTYGCNDPDKSVDNDWNVFATRGELDFNININENWTGFVKLRG